jgi:alpha-tubulin suppressor-like RCC1 family protein
VDRRCALHADGTVSCWMQDNIVQPIGPHAIAGVADATAISCGTACCALLDTGSVACWGIGLYGETTNHETLEDVTYLSFGGYYACATHSDGTAQCWGYNAYGALGRTGEGGPPAPVVGLTDATAVVAGALRTTALRSDGTVSVWGAKHPACTLDEGRPEQPVQGLSGVVAVSSGGAHSCAILDDTSVRCWGGNTSVLGAGPNVPYSCEPVAVLKVK